LTEEKRLAGFIGALGNKIEIFFLDPEFIGQGLGKLLMNFAITELKATEVDVNEDNKNAVQFYMKFGFVAYERSAKDSEGKDYPILKMRLVKG
jgi:putative acetyltransferase